MIMVIENLVQVRLKCSLWLPIQLFAQLLFMTSESGPESRQSFSLIFFTAVTSIMLLVCHQRMVSFGASFFHPQKAPTENCPTCCLWKGSFHYSFSDF